MKFRFVYVNDDGRQVEIESVAELRMDVDAGRIHDGTLLYDGLTRDWAPARVHPVYRLLRDGDAEGSDPPLEFELQPQRVMETDGEVELTPTELLDQPEEDAEEQFWHEQARAAAEAELEGRVDPGLGPAGIERVDPTSPRIAGRAAPRTSESHPDPAEESRPGTSPGEAAPPTLPVARPEPAPPPETIGPLDVPGWNPERSIARNVSVAIRTEVPRRQAALMILLAAISGWAIADSWRAPMAGVEGPEIVHVASAWRVSTHFTRGHADVRSAAFRDMVRGMDQLRARMGIDRPPEAWLSQAYLAQPSEHAGVAGYWGRYANLVDELRARESELFRSGYVSRMQRKGITGTVLTIQVARELVEFREDRPRREQLYQPMEELAAAALALHDGLLQDELARAEGRSPGTPGGNRELEVRRVLDALETLGGSDPIADGRLGDAAVASLAQLNVEEAVSGS